uniref:Putative secreted protein ovary overexpressed n=1 Tax=Rhipicephalus microplus TaxID=6941 RepID=A0A6M2DBN8_RHIMP
MRSYVAFIAACVEPLLLLPGFAKYPESKPLPWIMLSLHIKNWKDKLGSRCSHLEETMWQLVEVVKEVAKEVEISCEFRGQRSDYASFHALNKQKKAVIFAASDVSPSAYLAVKFTACFHLVINCV